MSILQGADLAIELGVDALTTLVLGVPEIAAYRAPFERRITIPDANGGGEAHFVIVAAAAEVRADGLVWRMDFERSSIRGRRGPHPDFLHLAGSIAVVVPVALVAGATDPSARALALALDQAQVIPTLTSAGLNQGERVALALMIAVGLQPAIRAVGARQIELPMRVVPAGPASLTPLVVTALQLVVIAPPVRSGQALALYAKVGASAAINVTPPAHATIRDGVDFALALSPAAFHTLVFVPAVMRAVGATSADQLPPTCGPAAEITLTNPFQWELTRAVDTFQEGFVQVDLHVTEDTPGTFGDTIIVDAHGAISFDRVGGRLRPVWTTTSVTGGRTFGWGWWLTAVLVPGLFLTMGAATLAIVAGAGVAASQLAFDLSTVDLSLPIGGLEFDRGEIHADVLVLSGTAVVPATTPAYASVTAATTRTIVERQVLSSGTYTSPSCPAGTYPYQRIGQRVQHVIEVTPSFMADPVTVTWSVRAGGAPVPITGVGTVALSTTISSGEPPSDRALRAVQIGCTFDGAHRLVLTNRIEDGTHEFEVVGTATDADGRSSWFSQRIQVPGDVLEFGGTWDADLAVCMHALEEALRRARGRVQRQPHPGGGVDPRAVVDWRALFSNPAVRKFATTAGMLPRLAAAVSERSLAMAHGLVASAPATLAAGRLPVGAILVHATPGAIRRR